MINELFELSETINKLGVITKPWHRKYMPIPNITDKSPCIKIVINEGKVSKVTTVKATQGSVLRKFGSNQGTFPCMNLTPLYKIIDEDSKKFIGDLQNYPEKINEENLSKIKQLCSINNWTNKFKKKYKISMQKTPYELQEILKNNEYKPLSLLIKESEFFIKPETLHQELEKIAFDMLFNKEDVKLAFSLLFYIAKDSDKEDDTGSLSVALDAIALTENGHSAINECFVNELNDALIKADKEKAQSIDFNKVDAFAKQFAAIEEPMPKVKLAGGFDVVLRTMFREHKCQNRYGRIENASHPISPEIRQALQASLEWLGSAKNKGKTWTKLDKNEILFAYPLDFQNNEEINSLPIAPNLANNSDFQDQTERFIEKIKTGKNPGTDLHARLIRIFILRKIDKARTKVVYSRLTNAFEYEKCCEQWTVSSTQNLPFTGIKPFFPTELSQIINRTWKQNGEELPADKFKPVHTYRGIELLFDTKTPLQNELHLLVQQALTLAPALNKLNLNQSGKDRILWSKVKKLLIALGMMLYRLEIKKEKWG